MMYLDVDRHTLDAVYVLVHQSTLKKKTRQIKCILWLVCAGHHPRYMYELF
jgi:hypothetical protein